MTAEIRIAYAAVLAAAAVTLHGAEEWDDVTCENYPDADAVLLDSRSEVRYNPDGTYEETCESWTKVLTEKGRKSESSITQSYSKRYGSAEIVYVGVVGTNGEERVVDTSATMKESTDNSCMGMNIYDPLDRLVHCFVPGLDIGETVHLKTRRKADKARCRDVWADVSVLEWSCPIVRSEIRITAPAERPLKRAAVRNPLGNVVESREVLPDGSTVHTFVCTNSPQAFPEPDMPALHTVVQHLRVSTAEDWPEISKWYWELCRGHVERATPEITNKVEEIVRGLESRDERMLALFKFVSQEVRYMGLTMEDTSPGYAPHDVDITFARRYGVCRDKAALLTAMLRIAGFEAYPVLIHLGEKRDPEVPQPFFNHAIVAVVRGEGEARPGEDDKYILMDPTNDSSNDLLPAYESDMSYIVARPDGELLRTSPTPPPDHNALVVDTRAELDGDGALYLEGVVRFSGINDTVYRSHLSKSRPEDRVKFFGRAVRNVFAGAELVKCDISPKDLFDTATPLSVALAFRLPEATLRGETREELTVPFLSRAFGMANFLLKGNTSLAERRFPLKLDSTAAVDETVEIKTGLPEGTKATLPDDERIDGDYGYLRTYSFTNGTLRARRRAEVSKVEFSPDEYLDLRMNVKRTEVAERKRPVFSRDDEAGANVRWRLIDNSADVFSDKAWTTTSRYEKVILTQEGKHESSELKFAFNPHVESVELVSAVVSNRDGTVKSVSAKEINVMDCSWAATAPRYPASKILVANLPSVEVGSVISYTVVNTVTNSPLPFYATFYFDSVDPVDCRRARVNGWFREAMRPRRVPNEPHQPAGSLWRDWACVSSNRFGRIDMDVRPIRPRDLAPELRELQGDMLEVCRWMARNVKIAGPDAWELPLDLHLTDPLVVLKERYASRLDFVRTLCALLRGMGCDADVVLAANDAGCSDRIRDSIRRVHPHVAAFSHPLCRITLREGGFLGFGSRKRLLFLEPDKEHAPMAVCKMAGCDYYDPGDGSLGVVTVPDAKYEDYDDETCEIDVRENGAVDMTVTTTIWGSGVGDFRKRYIEMLPEDRIRRYQTILGAISQSATATSDLETDTESYPATRKFSCFIPDYAIVSGDSITLQLPSLLSSIRPAYADKARKTPFSVYEADHETETVRVRFPEGYTEIEHLPESFTFASPVDTNRLWLVSETDWSVKDGCLEVEVRRTVPRRESGSFAPDYIEMVKSRTRMADSRASRTMVVRRRRHGPKDASSRAEPKSGEAEFGERR